ncbi:hypothetical protein B0H34DRAFT_846773, partial [Crassisporium funariophilum]
MKLRSYKLSKEEWRIVEQLAAVLKIFKQATFFFSGSTPNLSKIIPAMDYIDKHLASGSWNEKYLPSIQVSMLIRKRLLNKNYNATDHSKVYQIAMVLDPKQKLEYFQSAGWEESGLRQQERLLRLNLIEHTQICPLTLMIMVNRNWPCHLFQAQIP